MDPNEILKEIAADRTSIPECSNICAFNSDCACNCCNGGQSLCIANSMCASNIIVITMQPLIPPSTSSVSVIIPGGSCITKIYAAMPNASVDAKYILIEATVGSTNLFCHALGANPSTGVEFDTTFVQPLCVGSSDATVKVTALDQNNTPNNEFLTLTVVYCPNCC